MNPYKRITTDGVVFHEEHFKRGQAIDMPTIVETLDGRLISEDIGVLSVTQEERGEDIVLVIELEDGITDEIYYKKIVEL